MSDNEKRNVGGAGTGSLVESATSRHKQPIRPIDMQEESQKELHHKRSKAPAVPSGTEDLKDSVKNEKIESENAISTEKQKHNVAKKLSSVSKRRESSPESLKLAPPAVDVKKSSKSSVQPIPGHVPETGADVKKKKDDTVEEEQDSITEELRAPETARDASEWNTFGDFRKKEVSWDNEEYLSKVKLEDASDRRCQLEGKSSLGPCFRAAAPFGRPSGIALCLAKKSVREGEESYKPKTSTINISVSRRRLVNKTIYWDVKECPSNRIKEPKVTIKPKVSILSTMKENFSNIGNKIRNCF